MSKSSYLISQNGEHFLDQSHVKTQNGIENSIEISSTVLINSEKKSTHECERCGRYFVKLDDLLNHLQGHLNNKPYYCKFCYKRFTHTSSLSTHHRIHTGERPYKCKQCIRSFTKSSDLQRHGDVHKQKHYICFHCDKCYARESVLAKHLRKNECNLSKDGPFESPYNKQSTLNATPNIIVETFKSETKKKNKVVVLRNQQKYFSKSILNINKSFLLMDKSTNNVTSTKTSINTVEATKKKDFFLNEKIITSKTKNLTKIQSNTVSAQSNTQIPQTETKVQNTGKTVSKTLETHVIEREYGEMNKATPIFPHQPIILNTNQTVLQLPKKATINLAPNSIVTNPQSIIILQPQLLIQQSLFKPFILLPNTQPTIIPAVKSSDTPTSPHNIEWSDIINDSNNLLENSFF